MGREFLDQGKISISEPFLAGLSGQPADVTEWPFQIFIYAVNSVGGSTLVSLFVAFFAAVTAATYLPQLSRDTTKNLMGSLFIVVIFFIARERYAPRPEVVVYLLLAIALLLAESWRIYPDFKKLASISIIFLCWAPLHISWPLGVGAVMLTLISSPNKPFWRRATLTCRGKWVSALLAVLALFGVFYVAEFAYTVFAGMADGGNLAFISEMQPIWDFPEVALKFIFGAIFAFALAWGGGQGRIWRVARWFLFLLLGVLAARNYAMALLLMIPVSLEGLAGFDFSIGNSLKRFLPATTLTLFAMMVALSTFDRDPGWGFGVHKELFPFKAANFVKEKNLPAPIFNNFDIGGSLNWLWSGNPPTYIDPRALGGERHLAIYESIIVGDNSLSKLDSEGINTVLIKSVFQNSGRIYPLVHILNFSPNWRLLEASDALVFTRTGLSPEVDSIGDTSLWGFVDRESRMIIDFGRDAPHAKYSIALANLKMGKHDEGRALFIEAMADEPTLKPYYYRYIVEAGLRP